MRSNAIGWIRTVLVCVEWRMSGALLHGYVCVVGEGVEKKTKKKSIQLAKFEEK